MSAPHYRYLLTDLLTDQLLAELPLAGVAFSRHLCRVGSFEATMQAATPVQIAQAKLMRANAGRAALWVLRDGVIWWGGILWTAEATQGSRGPVQLEVQASTFESYLHHSFLYDWQRYNQEDQNLIAASFWWVAQARHPNADIGVDAFTGWDYEGVLRDREYRVEDHQRIGELLEQLGDVIGGPEHTIDVFHDAEGVRRKRLRVASRLGEREPRIVFQRAVSGGGRVQQWTSNRDAVDCGTAFQTRGETPDGNVGEDVPPLVSARVFRDDLLAEGWPLLDVGADFASVRDVRTLNDHAHALAAQLGGAVEVDTYSVEVGNTGWSPNRLGDSVRMKLRDDWHNTTTDKVARPVACEVRPPSEGAGELVALTVETEEVAA